MKNNYLKQMFIISILFFSIGGAYHAKAQSNKDNYKNAIQLELQRTFLSHWEDLNAIKFTRHKANAHWIISMYGLVGDGADYQEPFISIDFSKQHKGDALFGYTFKCDETYKKQVKDLFKNLKKDYDHVEFSKDINFSGPEFVGSIHKEAFFKLVNISNQLIHYCGLPREL